MLQIARKPRFRRLTGTLCLGLMLFYSLSVFFYTLSLAQAAPVPADNPTAMHCHMTADGQTDAAAKKPVNTAPSRAPTKNCCNTVGCCPMVSPLAFTPLVQQYAEHAALVLLPSWQHDYLVSYRLDRPPQATFFF